MKDALWSLGSQMPLNRQQSFDVAVVVQTIMKAEGSPIRGHPVKR